LLRPTEVFCYQIDRVLTSPTGHATMRGEPINVAMRLTSTVVAESPHFCNAGRRCYSSQSSTEPAVQGRLTGSCNEARLQSGGGQPGWVPGAARQVVVLVCVVVVSRCGVHCVFLGRQPGWVPGATRRGVSLVGAPCCVVVASWRGVCCTVLGCRNAVVASAKVGMVAGVVVVAVVVVAEQAPPPQ
jgi:hypothetical protein